MGWFWTSLVGFHHDVAVSALVTTPHDVRRFHLKLWNETLIGDQFYWCHLSSIDSILVPFSILGSWFLMELPLDSYVMVPCDVKLPLLLLWPKSGLLPFFLFGPKCSSGPFCLLFFDFSVWNSIENSSWLPLMMFLVLLFFEFVLEGAAMADGFRYSVPFFWSILWIWTCFKVRNLFLCQFSVSSLCWTSKTIPVCYIVFKMDDLMSKKVNCFIFLFTNFSHCFCPFCCYKFLFFPFWLHFLIPHDSCCTCVLGHCLIFQNVFVNEKRRMLHTSEHFGILAFFA